MLFLARRRRNFWGIWRTILKNPFWNMGGVLTWIPLIVDVVVFVWEIYSLFWVKKFYCIIHRTNEPLRKFCIFRFSERFRCRIFRIQTTKRRWTPNQIPTYTALNCMTYKSHRYQIYTLQRKYNGNTMGKLWGEILKNGPVGYSKILKDPCLLFTVFSHKNWNN